MFRKIQNLGLVDKYTKDPNIRRLLKLPQALAFIPVEDVLSTFEILKK